MNRRLYREFYLLPRGEQRALVLLSLLLILSLLFRITVQFLPEKEPDGMEEFEQEAGMILASFARVDSLERFRRDSLAQVRSTFSYQGGSYSRQDIKPKLSQIINLNAADSVHLLPLPGIGPVYAGRIIRYRNLLGGFVSVDQLLEVYGIPNETLDRIRDKIDIDTSVIHKIQLNHATFRELLKHPYLEYEDVKAIVNYREFKGAIQSLQELRDNYILPDSLMDRVLPYFDL